MKKFKFYWQDLTKECQKELFEFLGGENGNYDVHPFAALEIEGDPDDKDYDVEIGVEGYFRWHGKASNDTQAENLALDAVGKLELEGLEDIDYDIISVEESEDD